MVEPITSGLDLLVKLLLRIQGIAAIVALVSLMATFGIQLSRGDILRTIREYHLVARWLLANLIFVPLLAILFAFVFNLPRPVPLTLVLVAVAPGAPFIPAIIAMAGEDSHEAVRVTAALAIVATLTVPLFVAAMLFVLQIDTSVSPWQFYLPFMLVLVLPLLAGVVLRTVNSDLADRLAGPIEWVANVSLLVVLGIILLFGLGDILDVFATLFLTGAIVLLSLFVFLSIGIGWALGGPTARSRRILALGTAGRNINIALFIAVAVFPESGASETIVAFTILMFLNSVLVAIYWKRHPVSG